MLGPERNFSISFTEIARLHLFRHRLTDAQQAAMRALYLARQARQPFETGRALMVLMALAPKKRVGQIYRLGQCFASARERACFFMDMGRLFRGSPFDALGLPFLDTVAREIRSLPALPAKVER